MLHSFSRFYQNLFRFGGVTTEKPFCNPKIENNMGFFEPINTVLHRGERSYAVLGNDDGR